MNTTSKAIQASNRILYNILQLDHYKKALSYYKYPKKEHVDFENHVDLFCEPFAISADIVYPKKDSKYPAYANSKSSYFYPDSSIRTVAQSDNDIQEWIQSNICFPYVDLRYIVFGIASELRYINGKLSAIILKYGFSKWYNAIKELVMVNGINVQLTNSNFTGSIIGTIALNRQYYERYYRTQHSYIKQLFESIEDATDISLLQFFAFDIIPSNTENVTAQFHTNREKYEFFIDEKIASVGVKSIEMGTRFVNNHANAKIITENIFEVIKHYMKITSYDVNRPYFISAFVLSRADKEGAEPCSDLIVPNSIFDNTITVKIRTIVLKQVDSSHYIPIAECQDSEGNQVIIVLYDRAYIESMGITLNTVVNAHKLWNSIYRIIDVVTQGIKSSISLKCPVCNQELTDHAGLLHCDNCDATA